MTHLFRRALAGAPVAVCTTVLACSTTSGRPATEGESTADTDAADGAADTAASDAEEGDFPAYWSVDGALTVASGAVLTGEAPWTFRFWDAETNEICSRTARIAHVEANAAPPDVPAWSWWTATWTPADPAPLPATDTGDAPPCTAPLPSATTFGFGAPDPRLKTAMEQRGFLSPSGYYAAYLAADASRTFVFGIGSAAGGGPFPALVTAPPLPDGIYELHTLYLLPYAP